MNRRSIAAAVIAFAGIALSALFRPLWFDEVLTLTNFVFGRSIAQIYHSYVIPNNHLLYSFLLRFWSELPPLSGGIDSHFRLLSVLLGIAFLLCFSGCFRSRLGTAVTALLLLGFALSPAAWIYGTAVRGYMLSALLVVFVLHYALRFAAEPTKKNGVLYALFSLLTVAVIPSNLFAVGCAVCAALPVLGKTFWKRQQFYLLAVLPFAVFLLFYGPIFPDLLRCLGLHEGRGDRWNVLLQLLLTAGSILTFFLPAALAGVCCAFPKNLFHAEAGTSTGPVTGTDLVTGKEVRRKTIRRERPSWTARAARTWPRWLLVLLPFLPCFILPVAPFPRAFFACLPVLLYDAGLGGKHLFAIFRMRQGRQSVRRLFFLCAVPMLLAGWQVQTHRERISEWCGGAANDDFFAPYYMRENFAPGTAVRILKRAFPQSRIYCTFDSDPYAVSFYAAYGDALPERFAFDGPRGRAQGTFDLILARRGEPAERLKTRFNGVVAPLPQPGLPSFYRLYRLVPVPVPEGKSEGRLRRPLALPMAPARAGLPLDACYDWLTTRRRESRCDFDFLSPMRERKEVKIAPPIPHRRQTIGLTPNGFSPNLFSGYRLFRQGLSRFWGTHPAHGKVLS